MTLDRGGLAHADHFFHRGERHPEYRSGPFEQEHVKQGQREREDQDDFHALAGLAADLEGAAEG